MRAPDINNHPCFNVHAKGTCGRVHLPVAPDCNIKCNYCNRKYDCVNESRPGVSSSVLTPDQAVLYLEQVLEKAPNITVAGIAGPGDAFANPKVTMETLRLIRKGFPELLLCLATNGLNIGPYIEELAELNVSHVTMTVNAVDPEIGARIYSWVRDGKVIYRGLNAAKLLLERQLEAIAALKARGIIVKINTIVIPGINDHHVVEVAEKMAELGVDIQNCMTMYPNRGTPFADIPEPDLELMNKVRSSVEEIIPQMKHCTRCRADAVGLLDEDRWSEFRQCLSDCSETYPIRSEGKPYVAVATMEGMLVNMHLGEARNFQIWGPSKDGYSLIEEREAPEKGSGINRWYALAEILRDCRAVLVSGIGETPKQVLDENHILPVEMSGFIQIGLEAIYSGRNPAALKGRRNGCAKGAGCSGSGGGCG
jgi:nitrogen fixation protein NifB